MKYMIFKTQNKKHIHRICEILQTVQVIYLLHKGSTIFSHDTLCTCGFILLIILHK